jgi:predicted DNA-binding protein
MAEKRFQLNCNLTPDLLTRLNHQKQRTGVPKTTLVRRALDALLKSLESQERAVAAARQASEDGRDHLNR